MSGLPAFLARARRRLRRLWLVATFVWFAPAVTGLALALVVVGRSRPWAWPEPAALVLVVTALAATVVAALAVPVPDVVVARAVDRGVDGRDGLATAVELPEGAGPFAAPVHERARALAEGADLRRALPLRVANRRLVAGGALGALALIGGLAGNPQDEVRRRRAAEQVAIDAAAEEVEAAADRLAETMEPLAGDEPAVAELEALAAALDEAGTLAQARELLDRSEAALQAGLTAESLARDAALSGLERSVEAVPLPGAGAAEGAAAQLDAAAAAVAGLDDQARVDLAQRLERLAETQSAGNPAAAGALGEAAAALAAGDASGAASALRDAADAQRSAAASAASDRARRDALSTVADARQGLDGGAAGPGGNASDVTGAGTGKGAGDGSGKGSSDGSGKGAGDGSGKGSGDGSGNGNGSGQGGQPGGQNPGGGASGPVAGARGGNGAGRGGPGTAQGTPGADPVGEAARSDEPSLFDPAATGDDEVALGGRPSGDRPGEVVGRGDGPSTPGAAFVPLSRSLASFRQRVTAALDDPALSPSMRALVRSYFDRLTEGRNP